MYNARFKYRGFMAPVFTPFHNNDEKGLNLDVIPNYAKFLKSNDINGVLVNGTSGEATSQTVEEREEVAEAWIRATKDTGQTVMVQVGGTNLRHVQRLARHAERIGASAILCLADLFYRPQTSDDLVHYLNLISQHAPTTPLLYYHLPDFTGINVNMTELFQKADRIPNFAGIKFTSNDLKMGSDCLRVAGNEYVVFLGSDAMLLPAFSMGFDSVIGTTVNMMAKTNLNIYRATKLGDIQTALKNQKILTAAIGCITKYGTWVSTMKSTMNILTSINVGPPREPLIPLSAKGLHELSRHLNSMKLN